MRPVRGLLCHVLGHKASKPQMVTLDSLGPLYRVRKMMVQCVRCGKWADAQ